MAGTFGVQACIFAAAVSLWAADRVEVAPGVTYEERRFTRGGEPFSCRVLEVDPSHPAVNLLAVRAHDRAMGRETVSSMARRYGAVAAVNGGYFVTSGPYEGASTGVYQLHGEAMSGGTGRSAVVFCAETNYREQAEIDVVNFAGSATARDGASMPIAGLNRGRGANELVLYTPALGPSTLTAGPGFEVALDAAGRVAATAESNAAIPPGGSVLSGAGAAAEWLRSHAGGRFRAKLRLERAHPSRCRAEDVIGAGPRIVAGGKVAVARGERFGHVPVRHPRTAFALTRRGTFLFFTVDGRQAASVGMTLEELAAELVALGAVEAVNLDGGGSTTMCVDGRVRNSPSDGRERPVSDGILVLSVPDREAFLRLTETVAPLAAEELRAAFPRSRRALLQAVERAAATPRAKRLLGEAAASIPLHP